MITLVQELLHVNAYESAKKINSIFSLGVDFGKKSSKIDVNIYQFKNKLINYYKNYENETFQLLCDYLHLLYKWLEDIKNIKSNSFNELLQNKKFVEVLQNKDYVEYVIDTYFLDGSDEDKIWFLKNKKNYITKIKEEINERRFI